MVNSYSKKELARKVKVGTWIGVYWEDAAPTVELVIEKPNWKEAGDVCIETFCPNAQRDLGSGVVHTQIVKVLGQLVVPEI